MNSFQIMSEPIRRRIIEILSSGEHRSGELADAITAEFGVTRAAVSWHLAILRDNRWVLVREDASARIYSLEDRAWCQLGEDVKWLKRLWKRRIGQFSGNDPFGIPPQPKQPGMRRYKRRKSGTVKGMRGKGRRSDNWPVFPNDVEDFDDLYTPSGEIDTSTP
jgi:DNA-binding transcriptional ArsR family regulator